MTYYIHSGKGSVAEGIASGRLVNKWSNDWSYAVDDHSAETQPSLSIVPAYPTFAWDEILDFKTSAFLSVGVGVALAFGGGPVLVVGAAAGALGGLASGLATGQKGGHLIATVIQGASLGLLGYALPGAAEEATLATKMATGAGVGAVTGFSVEVSGELLRDDGFSIGSIAISTVLGAAEGLAGAAVGALPGATPLQAGIALSATNIALDTFGGVATGH